MRNSKIIFLLFLFGPCLFLPAQSFAFLADEITNHGAPEAYVYPDEFDKLVLDVTLASGNTGEEDILQAITLQNEGTARNLTDISKLILWQDCGEEGFQGMGIDEKIGEFRFYSASYSWYLSGLNLTVPAAGLRIFVSSEISEIATANRTLQFKISALLDNNENGQYDLGDLGVYLASGNNGPTDNYVLNPQRQTIRGFVLDNLAPKAVITWPSQGETIATSTYTVKGEARDQGGSIPQWVKIALTPEGEEEVWQEVAATSDNFLTWQYNWQNITEGTYNLKVKSKDWFDNEAISERIVQVKVEFPEEEEVVEEVAEEEEVVEEQEEEEEEEVAEPISEMTIEEVRAKIKEIQQKIIELISQLIELLQSQIAALQS